MTPDEFIAEVYRRGETLMPGGPRVIREAEFVAAPSPHTLRLYRDILPADPATRIADIGSGDGDFVAICHRLGFSDVTAFDFRAGDKFRDITTKFPFLKTEDVARSIAETFAAHRGAFDVLHFSHVVEHIPKYALLDTMDSLSGALKPGGSIIVRTPNMDGPGALSSYFVTLAHEYGFTGSNLDQLLRICGFDDVVFIDADRYQKLSSRIVRSPFLAYQKLKGRLFGVSRGGQFGSELIVVARRGA